MYKLKKEYVLMNIHILVSEKTVTNPLMARLGCLKKDVPFSLK